MSPSNPASHTSCVPGPTRRGETRSSWGSDSSSHTDRPETESAEREDERLEARIEKLDLERPIGDGFRLSDQLIQPRLGDGSGSLGVRVGSVRCGRRLPVDPYAKAHGRSSLAWAHGEIHVSRVKAINDPSSDRVQPDGFPE